MDNLLKFLEEEYILKMDCKLKFLLKQYSYKDIVSAIMSWIVEKKTSYVDVTMFARDFYIGSDLTNFQHPAIKILALAFLIMIGTALVAESLDFHIPKAYIYFSMAFALGVEFINIRIGTRQKEKGN